MRRPGPPASGRPDARPPPGRTVLVTDGSDGQNRSTLATVRALGLAGWEPVVTVSDGTSLAARSRWCRGTVPVPRAGEDGYADAVRGALDRDDHVTVLPCSDAAVVALDAPGRHLVDKRVVAQRTAAAGLPALPQEVVASGRELVAAAGRLLFPVVVKPAVRMTTAPSPARRVDDAAGLRALAHEDGPLVVQACVEAPMSAVGALVWHGRVVASVHQRYERTWPNAAGVACSAVTVEPDPEREEQLLHVVDGFSGIVQAQFVGPFLLDLNPRAYGSLPLAVAAGANLPALLCDLVAGRHVPVVRGRAGVRYRWWEGDVRHLLAAGRARTMSPAQCLAALAPRRGTAHSTEDLRDPAPAVHRLRRVLGTSVRVLDASHRRTAALRRDGDDDGGAASWTTQTRSAATGGRPARPS